MILVVVGREDREEVQRKCGVKCGVKYLIVISGIAPEFFVERRVQRAIAIHGHPSMTRVEITNPRQIRCYAPPPHPVERARIAGWHIVRNWLTDLICDGRFPGGGSAFMYTGEVVSIDGEQARRAVIIEGAQQGEHILEFPRVCGAFRVVEDAAKAMLNAQKQRRVET